MNGIGAHIRDIEFALSLWSLPYEDTPDRQLSKNQGVGSHQIPAP